MSTPRFKMLTRSDLRSFFYLPVLIILIMLLLLPVGCNTETTEDRETLDPVHSPVEGEEEEEEDDKGEEEEEEDDEGEENGNEIIPCDDEKKREGVENGRDRSTESPAIAERRALANAEQAAAKKATDQALSFICPEECPRRHFAVSLGKPVLAGDTRRTAESRTPDGRVLRRERWYANATCSYVVVVTCRPEENGE